MKSGKKKMKIAKSRTFLEESLLAAIDDGIAWHKGEDELRVTDVEINPPPDYTKTKIKAIRKELNVSQPVFAGIIGCSPGAVKAWEQGDKTPGSAARRLIQILVNNKHLVNDFFHKKSG